jgi:HK97 family phage prohead protease
VFGKPSHPLGGFVEVVEPSAFNKTRGNGWPGVTAKYEHRDLLGTTAAGTLQLEVIPTRGLDYVVDLPDTTAGNDVLALTARADLQNSSFAFQCYEDDFTHEDGFNCLCAI